MTIHESMIKYCGRAVAFVQYMPAKPIKHGIKVFCICCAVSGIMLAYKVYCGNKDKKTYGTSVQVCDRLVKEAELTKSHGRTNRYYLRIFCWALDRVIHAANVVVCFLIKSDIGQKQWKRYLDHHSGRHDFQIDLALSVMNYGIGLQ